MAKLEFTIADEKITRDLDAFCEESGWRPADGDKKVFAEQRLKDYFRGVSKASRLQKAIQQLTVED